MEWEVPGRVPFGRRSAPQPGSFSMPILKGGRPRSPRRSRSAGEGRGARPWGPGPHPARTDAGRDVRPGRLDPEGEGRGRGAVRARLLGLGDLRGQHLMYVAATRARRRLEPNEAFRSCLTAQAEPAAAWQPMHPMPLNEGRLSTVNPGANGTAPTPLPLTDAAVLLDQL